MKRILLILMFIFTISHQPSHSSVINNDLSTILNEAITSEFEVEEWEVISIDKISKKDFENIKNTLQSSHLVTVKNDENKVKYIFEAKNQSKYVNYSFHAIIPKNQENEITFQTVISGVEWDDLVQNYYKQLTNNLQKKFSLNFNKLFTCAKLNDDGIINNGFSDDEIWKKMKVVHKSEQYDNIQQSIYGKEIYGYTPLLDGQITVQEEIINFHMITKNELQNKKQIIIGTPIILNEY